MSRADPDRMLSPTTCGRLAAGVVAALARAGLAAEADVVAEEPVELAAGARWRVVGTRGPGVVRAVGVVLRPASRCPTTAVAWSRQAVGDRIVRTTAAALLPAHLALRVLYSVPDSAGRWRAVDAPRLGVARVGRLSQESSMRPPDPNPAPDALTAELIRDIEDTFGLTIDRDADPARYDEFVRRCLRRHQQRYQTGQLIDEAGWRNWVEDQLASLARLLNDRPHRPVGRRGRPGDIPLNG
jgi:hypothetical protein